MSADSSKQQWSFGSGAADRLNPDASPAVRVGNLSQAIRGRESIYRARPPSLSHEIAPGFRASLDMTFSPGISVPTMWASPQPDRREL